MSITTKNFFYEGAVEPILPEPRPHREVLRENRRASLSGDSSREAALHHLHSPRGRNMTAFMGDAAGGDLQHRPRRPGGGSATVSRFRSFRTRRHRPAHPGNSTSDSRLDRPLHPGAGARRISVLGGGVRDRKGVNARHPGRSPARLRQVDARQRLDRHPGLLYQRQHQDDSLAFYVKVPGLGLYDQDKLVSEPGTDTADPGQPEHPEGPRFRHSDLDHRRCSIARPSVEQDSTFFSNSSFVALLEGPPSGA